MSNPIVRSALPKLFFCAHQFLDNLGEHFGLVSELGSLAPPILSRVFSGQRLGAGPPDSQRLRLRSQKRLSATSKRASGAACACRTDPKRHVFDEVFAQDGHFRCGVNCLRELSMCGSLSAFKLSVRTLGRYFQHRELEHRTQRSRPSQRNGTTRLQAPSDAVCGIPARKVVGCRPQYTRSERVK